MTTKARRNAAASALRGKRADGNAETRQRSRLRPRISKGCSRGKPSARGNPSKGTEKAASAAKRTTAINPRQDDQRVNDFKGAECI
jgi:hypothetical protein